MEDDANEFRVRSVEETFKNYVGRRKGIIKALTKGNEGIGLYGFPSGKWQVILAKDVVYYFPLSRLHELPKQEMDKASWLAKVAADSDTWLFHVAFYFGGFYRYDDATRERLFNMMNELPTIYEVVTGNDKNQEVATEKGKKRVKDESTVSCHSSKKSKLNSKVQGVSSSRLVKDSKKQRQLPMQSAMQTRSKNLGIQTRAQTAKSPIKKIS